LETTGHDYDDLWYARRHWRDELPVLRRLQWADLHTYLHDDMLTKVDRATMAVSLEARPPLVDHRLVEFALRLDPRLLHDGARGKLLTRRHLRDRVPPGTLERRKIGFSMPVRHWARRQPGLMRSALERLESAGVVRRPSFASFTNEQCWCLLVLDRWLQQSGAYV
jgi:asparagine synthase (glutamine-hydrolysing)